MSFIPFYMFLVCFIFKTYVFLIFAVFFISDIVFTISLEFCSFFCSFCVFGIFFFTAIMKRCCIIFFFAILDFSVVISNSYYLIIHETLTPVKVNNPILILSFCAERTNNKILGPKPLRRFITREIAISPLENILKKSRIVASFFCVYSQFTPREKYLHPSCVAVLLVCRYFSFFGISVLCC